MNEDSDSNGGWSPVFVCRLAYHRFNSNMHRWTEGGQFNHVEEYFVAVDQIEDQFSETMSPTPSRTLLHPPRTPNTSNPVPIPFNIDYSSISTIYTHQFQEEGWTATSGGSFVTRERENLLPNIALSPYHLSLAHGPPSQESSALRYYSLYLAENQQQMIESYRSNSTLIPARPSPRTPLKTLYSSSSIGSRTSSHRNPSMVC